MRRSSLIALMVIATSSPVLGQTKAYTPLSAWRSPYANWEAQRAWLTEGLSKLPSRRPILAGLRPVSLELLQDALLRKQKNSLRNSPRLARGRIISLYNKPIYGRNVLHGAMAEALFLHRNPDWFYVNKPNAPQHDVYRHVPDRSTPQNGQIKFHVSGKAPNMLPTCGSTIVQIAFLCQTIMLMASAITG